jgi:hypothetical protein
MCEPSKLSKPNATNVWQMTTHSNFWRGTDGAEWIVEARREGRYQSWPAGAAPTASGQSERFFSTSRT